MESPHEVSIQQTMDDGDMRPEEEGVLTVSMMDTGRLVAEFAGNGPPMRLMARRIEMDERVLLRLSFLKTR
jgi:hypothetical protein